MGITSAANSGRKAGWNEVRYDQFMNSIKDMCNSIGFDKAECADIFSARYFWDMIVEAQTVILELKQSLNASEQARLDREWSEIINERNVFTATWLIGYLSFSSLPAEQKQEFKAKINKIESDYNSPKN